MNQYKAMAEEIMRYKNMRDSQPRSIVSEWPHQRPNVHTVQPNSLETEDKSTHSWQLTRSFENTNRLGKASEPLSTRSRRKKPEANQVDLDTKRDLENIMWELQELKRSEETKILIRILIWILVIKDPNESVPPNLRVPKEKFDGMTNPADHVACFESTLDLYDASVAIKCRAFPTTFKGVAQS